ncbi:MAG: hypothetical protein CUN55_17190, partial [Phototrophicales bacterium]
LSTVLPAVLPIVSEETQKVLNNKLKQTMVSATSLCFILYVYFTNRRVHAHWSHLRNADQMLPIRVALRCNMDVAGALIASNLLHVVLFTCVCACATIVYFIHAPRIPTVPLVSCILLMIILLNSQVIYCDELPRVVGSSFQMFNPWILIYKMPALHESILIAPLLKRSKNNKHFLESEINILQSNID